MDCAAETARTSSCYGYSMGPVVLIGAPTQTKFQLQSPWRELRSMPYRRASSYDAVMRAFGRHADRH